MVGGYTDSNGYYESDRERRLKRALYVTTALTVAAAALPLGLESLNIMTAYLVNDPSMLAYAPLNKLTAATTALAAASSTATIVYKNVYRNREQIGEALGRAKEGVLQRVEDFKDLAAAAANAVSEWREGAAAERTPATYIDTEFDPEGGRERPSSQAGTSHSAPSALVDAALNLPEPPQHDIDGTKKVQGWGEYLASFVKPQGGKEKDSPIMTV